MSETRHCTLTQIRTEGPWLTDVTLGGMALAFGASGSASSNGNTALPESVGIAAEKRPQRYRVTWHDGPCPATRTARAARATIGRRPEPPTREEIIAAGVAASDADAAVAFQRYIHAQAVFPYGVLPMPPKGSEPMLDRFLRHDDLPNGNEPVHAEPEARKSPGPKRHFDRRREELEALVADEDNGGDALRAIAERLNVAFDPSRRNLAAAILAAERPHDTKRMKR